MQPGQFLTEYLDALPRGKRMMSASDFKKDYKIEDAA